jgi:Bacterial dnaA protein helix-turn-helix
MLDVSRLDAIVCTTALEVELLAALVRERRLRGIAAPIRRKPDKTHPKVYWPNDPCGPVRPRNEALWIPAGRATVLQIQNAVCRCWGVTVGDLRSERRTMDVVAPRQAATMLCRTLTLLSYPQMAKRFGHRDHTTMMHNAKRMDWLRTELLATLTMEDSLWIWVTETHKRFEAAQIAAKVAAAPIDIPAFPMNGHSHG